MDDSTSLESFENHCNHVTGFTSCVLDPRAAAKPPAGTRVCRNRPAALADQREILRPGLWGRLPIARPAPAAAGAARRGFVEPHGQPAPALARRGPGSPWHRSVRPWGGTPSPRFALRSGGCEALAKQRAPKPPSSPTSTGSPLRRLYEAGRRARGLRRRRVVLVRLDRYSVLRHRMPSVLRGLRPAFRTHPQQKPPWARASWGAQASFA